MLRMKRTKMAAVTMTKMMIMLWAMALILVATEDDQTAEEARRIIDALDPTGFDKLPNMLQNPSFENTYVHPNENPWEGGNSFVRKQNCADSVHGRCSFYYGNRTTTTNGAMQILQGLKPGRGYAMSGYIKLLNDKDTSLWQSAKATLTFNFTDDPEPPEFIMMAEKDNETNVPEEEKTRCRRTGEAQKTVAYLKPDRSKEISYVVAYRGFLTSQDGWVHLSGDINAPMREFADEVKFSLNGPDTEIDFLVDDLRLVEVPELPDWEELARTETEKHRMSHFDLTFDLPENVAKDDIDVEVKLTNHLFAFGMKIQPDCVVTPKAKKYNDYVYKVFNWVTIGSYKWKMGQAEEADLDFSDAVDSTRIVGEHGLKIRAHSILWGVTKNVPEWVQELSGSELRNVVLEHIKYMVDLAKGKVEQWDVQNEYIHGHFYEDRLQDRNFTMDVFRYVRQLDPDVKLYTNDFMAVTTGAQTQDLVDIVKRFRKNGAPIDGIGIQGHTKDYVKPDPLMIWYRLNKPGKVPDLDVMVTEFDIGHKDDVIRADWLEDAIRAFFAHPVLKGVILWGFWNIRMRYENKYLAYGDRMKLSEGGIRYACLLKNEWTTHEKFSLSEHPDLTVNVHGFRGDYELIVRKKGVPVQRETFRVDRNRTVPITVTSSQEAINVTYEENYVTECTSRRDQKSLGDFIAYIRPMKIRCGNRNHTSTEGHASVQCDRKEILLGCSGQYPVDLNSEGVNVTRQGERITLEDGIPTCNAYGTKMGPDFEVTAIGRCCVLPALECQYRQAGPSLRMADALAETRCPNGTHALGCAAYSERSHVRGVAFRTHYSQTCFAKNGPARPPLPKSGVISTATCCKKDFVKCVMLHGVENDTSTVACPVSQQLMTSCFGEGLIYSAEIVKEGNSEETCVVRGKSGRAIATCCFVEEGKDGFEFLARPSAR